MALADIPPGASRGNGQGAAAVRTGVRVLVVEDDARVGDTLVQLLQHYGFVPRLAPTIADAMRDLDAWTPQALLLDLMMPDGSGTSVLRHIRAAGRPCRVAVLTAVDDARVLGAVNALRPDRVFVKPVDFLDLKAWLDQKS